ncbi:Mitochondrial transcription factor 1 [Spathaspora sp. JA1]|nr:Mitochondrial transcription factor 1 [Spathaspora sp. JA1]
MAEIAFRSFNPAFKNLLIKKSSRTKTISNELFDPKPAQQIVNNMNLWKLYPDGSKLDIIDCNPGGGLFSTMLNYELRPRAHILLEKRPYFVEVWRDYYLDTLKFKTGNKENFILYPKDPHTWTTFTDLIEVDKIIQPVKKPYDQVHDELLVVANWGLPQFEAVVAQWIRCCGDRNWLQKYGKVRVICTAESNTLLKFLSDPGFKKRNRTSLKRDLYTESKLLAILSHPAHMAGRTYDPRVLCRDQPVAAYDKAIHKNRELGIFEFMPSGLTSDAISDIEFLLSPLYHLVSTPLKYTLPKLAPGAEYMEQYLPAELLHKSAREFTTEDILAFAHAYDKWPFKPEIEDIVSASEML